MATKIAGRIATAGVVLASYDSRLTGGHHSTSHVRCGCNDAAWRRPDRRRQVSRSLFGRPAPRTCKPSTTRRSLTRWPARRRASLLATSSGNDFEPDLFYRGFDATAVTGTPQGLAVYQNGTRINEAFGDTVNWDLIPDERDRHDDDHRLKPDLRPQRPRRRRQRDHEERLHLAGRRSRSRGRLLLARARGIQYGKQIGNYSVYMAASQINDGGWRVDGASQLTNFYGDVGYKANGFKSHLQLTAGNNQFGVAAYTPLQQLQTNWGSVFTVPQTTYNQMAMLQWTGSYAYSPTLNFQGGAYFRQFNQQHVDGNGTDVTPCPPYSCLGGDRPAHSTIRHTHPRHLTGRNARPRRGRRQPDAIALCRRQRAGRRHRQGLRP